MVFAIITAFLAYRKAKDSGRSGILWAVAGAGVFIGTQLIASFTLGLLLGFAALFFGWSEEQTEALSIVATILAIVASFFSSWLLLKYLDRLPEDETSMKPPEPPIFGETT